MKAKSIIFGCLANTRATSMQSFAESVQALEDMYKNDSFRSTIYKTRNHAYLMFSTFV